MADVTDKMIEYWAELGEAWEAVKPEIQGATGWLVLNPIKYDEGWHELRLRTYRPQTGGLMIVGLNAGLYGMAQTGIPFTDQGVIAMRLKKLLQVLLEAKKWTGERGQAPKELLPYLSPAHNSENSSWPVYELLMKLYGSAEKGLMYSVAINPCPLVFIDPANGANKTPVDFGEGMRKVTPSISHADVNSFFDRMNDLRRVWIHKAAEILEPGGVLLLGKNVQDRLGPNLKKVYEGAEEPPVFADFEHPYLGEATWVAGALKALKDVGFPRPNK